MQVLRAACFLAIPAITAIAQTVPAFDVASIRANNGPEAHTMPPRLGPNIQVLPDGVTLRRVALKTALAWSYRVMDYQISGPDWLGTERFDIAAKAGAQAPEDQLRVMMQTLLADRFKIALHRQTKEMQAYVLVVGKNGPKVTESKTEGDTEVAPDEKKLQVSIRRTPITPLLDLLYNVLRAPIVDETGLKGKYDLQINMAKYRNIGPGSGPVDPVGIITTALQEELGLKLESRKMPIDLLVIDRAEKIPTEN